jgi:hypothetical protein
VKLPMADDLEREDAPESLRLAAADALERGLGFVEAHGDALAQLRAMVLLEAMPVDALVEAMLERQAEDGSFEPLGVAAGGSPGFSEAAAKGLPDGVLGGLEALCILGDADAINSAPVPKLAAWLGTAQDADGAWGGESLDVDTRLFATGMLAGLLGRTRSVRPHVLEDAGNFMGGHWAPEQVEGRAWARLTAFGVFFSGVDHDLADEALQWVGRELERGYRTRVYDAAATVRVLLHCDASAVPGATLEPPQLLADVLAEQGVDGGFAELAPGGPAGRVAPTLDCMRAILRLCQII